MPNSIAAVRCQTWPMQAHDLMIVTRVAPAAITEAYACMKRLHYAHAIGQFRVLVNHVQSGADAQTAFDNLAGVAGRYLTVRWMPRVAWLQIARDGAGALSCRGARGCFSVDTGCPGLSAACR